jgi:hypothetical protein
MKTSNWWAPRRLLIAAVAGLLALALPVHAEGLDKLDCSLKSIPAEAAFYTVMLRNREQIDIVTHSRAWAKLMDMPAVKMALQMVQGQLKNPDPKFAEFLKIYQLPENQQLLQLLADMVSDEIFFYGGSNTVDCTAMCSQLISELRTGSMFLQVSGQGQNLAPGKLQAVTVLRTLARHADEIKMPDLVLGFKLRKTEPALAQLTRLENLLKGLEQQHPPLKGRVQRAKTAGGDFVSLTLDGSMVPWEKINLKQYETKPDEFEGLLTKLKRLKLTLGIGVRGNYLLIVVADSLEALSRMDGDKRLIDRPELKPLVAHADKRLTSINYVSQALAARSGMLGGDFNNLTRIADSLLPKADLTEEQRDKIRKDLTRLSQEIKAAMPAPGASLSFSFLTDQGTEGYSYDWGEHPKLDGSKPLTILNHVGGSPLLAVAGRSTYSPQSYQALVKWLKVAHGYFDEMVVPKLGAEEKQKYEQVVETFGPFLKRLDEVTGKQFLPSLADGQAAFVLDGKLQSKQWQQSLPPSENPLPMLEPALVFGVSDADKLKSAVSEYRTIINEIIAKVHELQPNLPDYQIPEPGVNQLKSGTCYFYPLPEQFGVDSQIVPNAGLSEKFAVLSISQDHTERLLADSPLKAEHGVLADTSRPLAMVVYFNWAGTVTTLTPWIETATSLFVSRHAPGGDGGEQPAGLRPEDILKQVRTGLEILKVFRSFASVSYFENKVLVTHSETVFKDLPE